MNMRNVKGTRDIPPQQKIIRNTVISLLQNTFEQYGFNPLETPALELEELLTSKYAGGAEILKEIFTLTDNADRKLGLRYDLTVPFARFIASNPQLKKPFKRYQIDRVWRNGPIKLGRYREFWQCDADVVGIKSVLAEAELLTLAKSFFSNLGISVRICVNNRKILAGIVAYAEIDSSLSDSVMLTIDKLDKISVNGVRKELVEKGLTDEQIEKLFSLTIAQNVSFNAVKDALGENEGVTEFEEMLSYIQGLCGTTDFISFTPSLARGLAYYTGTIWEFYAVDSEITSAIGAGGRYDTMISKFTGAKEDTPAVGISFGLDRIADVLVLSGAIKAKEIVTDVYVIPLKTTVQSLPYITAFRDTGLRVDFDANNRPMRKNIDFANKYGIPFIVLLGEDEIAQKKVTVKNMQSGDQQTLSVTDAVALIKKEM